MSWQVSVAVELDQFHLDVELSGGDEPLMLIGPNGSGKTTLLLLIAGIIKPKSGRIVVNDRVIYDSKNRIDLAVEDRRFAYMPQGYGLFPHLSVLENIAFGLSIGPHKKKADDRQKTALQLLTQLKCADLKDLKVIHLSGGEAQRIALARAMIIQPQVLLLDEPLAALDAAVKKRVRQFLIEHLSNSKKPAIVTSHDLRDIVAFDREICVIENGRIVQRGKMVALKRKPLTPFTEEFFAVPELQF